MIVILFLLPPPPPPPQEFHFKVDQTTFATLIAAVDHAPDNGIIEVLDDGPFISGPVSIKDKALTIRASKDVRPVILLDPKSADTSAPLISTNAPITFEGLEFQRISTKDWQAKQILVFVTNKIVAKNCRFLLKRKQDCVQAKDSKECQFLDCEFISNGGNGVSWSPPPSGGRMVMKNCLQIGQSAIIIHYRFSNLRGISLDLEHNTLITPDLPKGVTLDLPQGKGETRGATLKIYIDIASLKSVAELPQKAIDIIAKSNIISTDSYVMQLDREQENGFPFETKKLLSHLVQWSENGNGYSVKRKYLYSNVLKSDQYDETGFEAWSEYWKLPPSTGSKEQKVEFEKPVDAITIKEHPEEISANNFRVLNPASDCGINVPLTGPGEPYWRWLKSTSGAKN